MNPKTYMVFNTEDNEGNHKQLQFDVYSHGEFPQEGAGVYIFSKNFDNSKMPEYNHIGYTLNFSHLFKEKDINQVFKKLNSNSFLVFKCDDEMLMEKIVQWISKSHKIITKQE